MSYEPPPHTFLSRGEVAVEKRQAQMVDRCKGELTCRAVTGTLYVPDQRQHHSGS